MSKTVINIHIDKLVDKVIINGEVDADNLEKKLRETLLKVLNGATLEGAEKGKAPTS